MSMFYTPTHPEGGYKPQPPGGYHPVPTTPKSAAPPPPTDSGGNGGKVTLDSNIEGQRDALAQVMIILNDYGLASLADWAWKMIQSGESTAGIQIDLYNQPAFQQRFWVIGARQKAGLDPVSPTDILNFEQSWTELAHAAGLPPSFANKDMAQQFMANNVSFNEAQERVQRGFIEMHNAPTEVRDMFGQYFGSRGDAALAAMFMDTQRALPDLERMVTEAKIGGRGVMQGFTVNEGLANRLAKLGVTDPQAGQGFDQLAHERQLFTETISEHNDITEQQGIEGQFGLDAGAQQQVERRAETRKAATAGTGATQEDQSGVIGLGQARST